MVIKQVLVLYKKSTYKHYFLDQGRLAGDLDSKAARHFEPTHVEHYQTLDQVERVLKSMKVKYRKVGRGQRVDFEPFDLVVTIGGDGTFLEAARSVRKQLILGVNSDPSWSVGRFCSATASTFSRMMEKVMLGKSSVKVLNRIRVRGLRENVSVNVLNDVLVCHSNPAAMSRYDLVLNGIREEQRSSGVWVATSAGSTGAIKSAGGRLLPLTSSRMQYMVRELYPLPGSRYRFSGGILAPKQSLKLVSRMKDGMVFVDGSHQRFHFYFGDEVTIARSPEPLSVVGL